MEEADIHMSPEGVDVPERRVSHARRGMAILQKLANVRSAAAHLFKPWLGDPSRPVVRLGEPCLDAGVSPNGARKPKEFAHWSRLSAWLVMSSQRVAKQRRPPSPSALFGFGVTSGLRRDSLRVDGLAEAKRAGAKAGAPGRTRTNTALRPTDFESAASTISPLGRRLEALATGARAHKTRPVVNLAGYRSNRPRPPSVRSPRRVSVGPRRASRCGRHLRRS